MSKNPVKRAQKESFLFQEIASFLLRITLDDTRLQGLYVNRVALSPDGGSCHILFLSHGGKEEFQKKLPFLLVYKGSLRTALAKVSHGRYVPQLVFDYDDSFEKTEKINTLIDQLKKEGRL